MAHLPYLSAGDLPPDERELLARPIYVYRALANNPAVLRHVDRVGMWFRHESQLDAGLRELAVLEVARVLHSPYVWSHHIPLALAAGVAPDAIDAISAVAAGASAEALRPEQLTVLKAAGDLARCRRIDPGNWAALAAFLTVPEMVELVVVAAYYVQMCCVTVGLDIDVEPSYLPHLDRHPLPAPPG